MQVTIPARYPRVMSPAAAMTRLGSIATGQDARVAELVKEASQDLADFLGLAPWRQTYSASLRGYGGTALQLPIAPVEPGTVSIDYIEDDLEDFVLDSRSGILHRAAGWPDTAAFVDAGSLDPARGSEVPTIEASFVGGWVVPEDLKLWTASLAVLVGDFVKPPWPAQYLHEVTVAGTMAATAPTWATTVGTAVVSNTATLVARAAMELPASLTGAFVEELIARFHRNPARDPSLASRSVPGLSVTWRAPESSGCADLLCASAAARAQRHVFYGGAAA